MRRGRWTAAGLGWLSAGVLTAAAGVGVTSAGTGALGLETHTFTRVDCRSVSVKGGTVWHCIGESPAQVRANDEADRRAAQAALRAHRDGVPSDIGPHKRTRLTFVDHDGRRDPQEVTASRVPVVDRWIAHSGNVVGAGVLLTVFGIMGVAWSAYRLRPLRPG
ncbi:hypothetical protein [Spirillospora sp. NPDC048819]|uniref:hypothetical protein n=1 Tax=Spirillospora sp. NPDC048819 TaxID=3155268 RepID=UPI0034067423